MLSKKFNLTNIGFNKRWISNITRNKYFLENNINKVVSESKMLFEFIENYMKGNCKNKIIILNY